MIEMIVLTSVILLAVGALSYGCNCVMRAIAIQHEKEVDYWYHFFEAGGSIELSLLLLLFNKSLMEGYKRHCEKNK